MKASKRLNKDFKPSSYQLLLTPNIDELTFEGEAVIEGRLTDKTCSELLLHGNQLEIQKVTINGQLVDFRLNQELEEIILNLPEPSDENLKIEIEYKGVVRQDATGLYLSTYEEDNQTKKMLATQLEPVYARRIFPCIDEPSAKSTFQLSVITASDKVVISNTLIDEELSLSSNQKKTCFKPTPVMSSYLLALIVGDMEFVETQTQSGVIIRTYAIKNEIEHAEKSLTIAKDVIEFYDDYFGLPYPLENLNQVAMPDMEAGVGAMENWGCIVYRSDSLLVDPDKTSLPMQQYNAIVIAHEIAHQWFGNLVTMEWWDDLWLNESFATWIEYKVSDKLFPQWNLWDDFVANDYVQALQLDSRGLSHPVVAEIINVKEISQAFDAITYRKGASVIRMLENYLGENTFRDGVRLYMQQHQYKNATTNDLWKALSEVSKKDVKAFMYSWTEIMGHPIVEFKDGAITQERFVYNSNHQDDSSQSWLVPLTSNDGQQLLLDKPSLKSDLQFEINNVNPGSIGFFRVKYSSNDIQKTIKSYLDLPSAGRISFFTNIFDQAEAGFLSLEDVLPSLKVLSKENSAHVWDSAIYGLSAVNNLFFDEKINLKIFQDLSQSWLQAQTERLGYEVKPDETPDNTLVRPIILGLSAKYQFVEVVDQLAAMFEKITTDGFQAVDKSYRGVVYSVIAKNGTQTEFDELLKLYKSTQHSEEQRRLTRALCGFKEHKFAQQALSLIKTDAVRVQDAYMWVLQSYANLETQELAWQWVENNWQWLNQLYGSSPLFGGMLRSFAANTRSKNQAHKVISFIESQQQPHLEKYIANMRDITETNLAWIERDQHYFN